MRHLEARRRRRRTLRRARARRDPRHHRARGRHRQREADATKLPDRRRLGIARRRAATLPRPQPATAAAIRSELRVRQHEPAPRTAVPSCPGRTVSRWPTSPNGDRLLPGEQRRGRLRHHAVHVPHHARRDRRIWTCATTTGRRTDDQRHGLPEAEHELRPRPQDQHDDGLQLGTSALPWQTGNCVLCVMSTANDCTAQHWGETPSVDRDRRSAGADHS